MSNSAMSRAEREAFLAGVHVAVLAIADPARGPLAVPVWYDYAPGGEVRFVTGGTSRKGQLLAEGGRVSLCVQTEAPPYKYVSVEGEVVAIESADVERDVRPLACRYLGAAGAARYIASTHDTHGAEPEVLVRVRIERWLSCDYSKEFGAS